MATKAKHSAAKKPYHAKKKPYLTKKETILTVTVILVIALGWFLFERFYNDGALSVTDGVAQVEGEYSLLINTNTASVPRYHKLGQAGEVDGYTIREEPYALDMQNLKSFEYVPEQDDALVTMAQVNGSFMTAEKYATTMHDARNKATGTQCGELMTTTLGEHKVFYFASVIAPETDEEGNVKEGAQYSRSLDYFIAVGDRSIYFTFYNKSAQEDGLCSDDELFAAAEPFVQALTYETK